jgi:leucyl aminopeptidase
MTEPSRPPLNLTLTANEPAEIDADLLILAVGEAELESGELLGRTDARVGGVLRRAAGEERFRGKLGQTLVVHVRDIRPQRVALVGLGAAGDPTGQALRVAAGAAARIAAAVGAPRVAFAWASPASGDDVRACEIVAEGALLGSYRFDKYLTDDRSRRPEMTAFVLRPPGSVGSDDGERAFARARSTARAVARARDLVNEPAGTLTPTALTETVSGWARDVGLSVEVFDRAGCAALGMGLYLAVAQGSTQEPRFIHLAWTPPGARRRVVIVGKGVTFDSGGLSLKTNEGMLDMKTDMAGAAAVLAAAAAAAEEKLPVELHALAACTENMPSGTAYKLGDVIRSLDGKTVEINNTDAEGRLTLADALSFGLRFKPDAILDFATLTGACMVALGPHTAGVMSNDDPLAGDLMDAARRAGEEMWRLPLPPRLAEQLKSDVADFKNTGERWGGALTAGLFLQEFVRGTPWVHVDIAGPSSASKEYGHVAKGGTGFAASSILEFLRAAST